MQYDTAPNRPKPKTNIQSIHIVLFKYLKLLWTNLTICVGSLHTSEISVKCLWLPDYHFHCPHKGYVSLGKTLLIRCCLLTIAPEEHSDVCKHSIWQQDPKDSPERPDLFRGETCIIKNSGGGDCNLKSAFWGLSKSKGFCWWHILARFYLSVLVSFLLFIYLPTVYF